MRILLTDPGAWFSCGRVYLGSWHAAAWNSSPGSDARQPMKPLVWHWWQSRRKKAAENDVRYLQLNGTMAQGVFVCFCIFCVLPYLVSLGTRECLDRISHKEISCIEMLSWRRFSEKRVWCISQYIAQRLPVDRCGLLMLWLVYIACSMINACSCTFSKSHRLQQELTWMSSQTRSQSTAVEPWLMDFFNYSITVFLLGFGGTQVAHACSRCFWTGWITAGCSWWIWWSHIMPEIYWNSGQNEKTPETGSVTCLRIDSEFVVATFWKCSINLHPSTFTWSMLAGQAGWKLLDTRFVGVVKSLFRQRAGFAAVAFLMSYGRCGPGWRFLGLIRWNDGRIIAAVPTLQSTLGLAS